MQSSASLPFRFIETDNSIMSPLFGDMFDLDIFQKHQKVGGCLFLFRF